MLCQKTPTSVLLKVEAVDGGVPRLTSTATVSVQVRASFSKKVLFCSVR